MGGGMGGMPGMGGGFGGMPGMGGQPRRQRQQQVWHLSQREYAAEVPFKSSRQIGAASPTGICNQPGLPCAVVKDKARLERHHLGPPIFLEACIVCGDKP